ncbi:uncharacterized protein LOC144199345 [Stigmatopora nigra]
MGSEKPSFLTQPVVKSIFMFRNGDLYYEARRLVINQKRVSNFETLLREVTGGIQAPFGAVRNIYTPRGGHKVDSLDSIQSGEQYVAAGREKFKKLDYLQISSRKRRMLQSLPLQARPMPPNRIPGTARFLKPIKEPCPIFVVANGDTLTPAIRLLIHQRMLSQFERILEMISEKIGLRVLGGVRSLYTYEGQQVTDGTQMENGQLYVAVGREKFKKLSYIDLLFSKPRGTWKVNGMKMGQLPPIYRSPKQNANKKTGVQSTDSGNGGTKDSPPNHSGGNGEHLSTIVREISQARLLSLRLKRSGQSITLCDNDDSDSKTDDGNADVKFLDQSNEKDLAPDPVKSSEVNNKEGEEAELPSENTFKNEIDVNQEEKKDRETKSPTEVVNEENETEKSENKQNSPPVPEEQVAVVKEEKDMAVDEMKRAIDDSRATPDESCKSLAESKEKVPIENKEHNEDVSEFTANISENVADVQKEIMDVSKGEIIVESKDDVNEANSECEFKYANDMSVDVTDKVSDESKDGGKNDCKDDADEAASESKHVTDMRDGATDEVLDESKDQGERKCKNDVDESASKPKLKYVNDIRNDALDEGSDEIKEEDKKECKDDIGEAVSGHKFQCATDIRDDPTDRVLDESKDEVQGEVAEVKRTEPTIESKNGGDTHELDCKHREASGSVNEFPDKGSHETKNVLDEFSDKKMNESSNESKDDFVNEEPSKSKDEVSNGIRGAMFNENNDLMANETTDKTDVNMILSKNWGF